MITAEKIRDMFIRVSGSFVNLPSWGGMCLVRTTDVRFSLETQQRGETQFRFADIAWI